jgi:hypothetical protein
MMPRFDQNRTWTVPEIEAKLRANVPHPLSRDWSGYGFLRRPDGAGVYAVLGDERAIARAYVFCFRSGKMWSVDSYWLDARKDRILIDEPSFRRALEEYGAFLAQLGISPPYVWIAGMANLKGRFLYAPAKPGVMRATDKPQGKCMRDFVISTGEYVPGDPPGQALRPFFTELYEACAVTRESWQDE